MRTLIVVSCMCAIAACSERAPTVNASPHLIAHRGVHPYYHGEDRLDRLTGCSATLLHESLPAFIENTIPSIRAAAASGATMVEIDIHRSRDSQLVVFHDATLQCRTDGSGRPEDKTLDELKALDAGYGYTADGRQFPFRGKGIGLIPTLAEVLDSFPHLWFVLDDKAGSAALIATQLAKYPASVQARIVYWGSARRYELIRTAAPAIGPRMFTRNEMIACGKAFAWRLTLGALPQPCTGALLIAPGSRLRPSYVRAVIGWPDRFLRKVRAAGTSMVIATDSVPLAIELIDLPIFGIMTDVVHEIGPALGGRADSGRGLTRR